MKPSGVAPTFSRPVCVAWLLASIALAASLIPARADARPVKSKLTADVSGFINRQGTVTYYFSGGVNAEELTFGCMEGRRVVLFRVEEGGAQKQVASAETGFFGGFSEPLEMPLSAISGRYYAKVKPRVRKLRKGRLRCLPDRTPTFLVRVPAELL